MDRWKNTKCEIKQPLTRVWQKWRFIAPQTHLWLIELWFSASAFVVKIATFAKPKNVIGKFNKQTNNNKYLINYEITRTNK
jgi:hypothetical protein